MHGKIFGREPALWIAAINSLILIVGTFGLGWFTGEQADLWVVAVNAIAGVATALTVRPISPAAFTYALSALLALAASYGLSLPDQTVVMINASLVPILTLLFRGQVSPQDTPVSRS